ncbi:hypothetical protein KFU94_34890 [Chloroflexi bacterium TSY]|nr:hypothetical protein [Chloroflexi bacterium TSY]
MYDAVFTSRGIDIANNSFATYKQLVPYDDFIDDKMGAIIKVRNYFSSEEEILATHKNDGYFTGIWDTSISNDGQNVVFKGILSANGARELGGSEHEWGIFMGVFTPQGWVLRPALLTHFQSQMRVGPPILWYDSPGINNARTIAFQAKDTTGRWTIYAVQMPFFSTHPTDRYSFQPASAPHVVAQEGMPLPSGGRMGRVQLSVSDKWKSKTLINNQGTIAFAEVNNGRRSIWLAKPTGNNNAYDPEQPTTYINNFDAGPRWDLPRGIWRRSNGIQGCTAIGGNAGGAAALTMLINALEHDWALQRNGPSPLAQEDLRNVYDKTGITRGTITNPRNPSETCYNRPFVWRLARDYIESAGFNTRLETNPADSEAFLNENLAKGSPVLVSTRFSARRWFRPGPGHVVLFWGRSGDGDYVVSDAAGDYFSSGTNHYGPGKYGGYKVYKEEFVKSMILGRPLLAVDPVDRESATQVMAASANLTVRRVFGVTAYERDDNHAALRLWVEDGSGRRSGILANGAQVTEIPGSSVFREPLAPADSSLPAEHEEPSLQDQLAISISVDNPPDDLHVVVHGLEASEYELDITLFAAGGMAARNTSAGSVNAGQQNTVDVSDLLATPALVTDNNRYEQGQSVTAYFFNAGGAGAKIDLVKAGSKEVVQTQLLNGSIDGDLSFDTNGLEAGPYELRLFTAGTESPSAIATVEVLAVPEPIPTPTATPPSAPTPWPTPGTPLPAQGNGVSLPGIAQFGLGRLHAVALAVDETEVALGDDRGNVALFDLSTQRITRRFDGHQSAPIRALAFAPDGQHLLSGGDDSTLRLWNVATGKQERIFVYDREYSVYAVAFTLDGSQIAAGGTGRLSSDYTLAVWDVATARQVRTLPGHNRQVSALALSPDGTRLASASHDQSIIIWDTATWEQVRSLKGHTFRVEDVAFADNTTLASASSDRTARL